MNSLKNKYLYSILVNARGHIVEETKSLRNHRESIKSNANSFFEDKARAFDNMTKHIWDWVKIVNPNVKKNKIKNILLEIASMIFEAQGEKPLFQFGEEITAWNRPADWSYNYIRYEIGHKTPMNAGGTSHPENLCFMSARCNQHIQSSLEMHNVIDWYFSNNTEVQNRINNLEELYKSDIWKEKINQIISPL